MGSLVWDPLVRSEDRVGQVNVPFGDGLVGGEPETDQQFTRRIFRDEVPDNEDNPDRLNGLVGIGVYALESLPKPSAFACLREIVSRLHELAVEVKGGVTWETPPNLVIEMQRESAPEGYYNLGLAHGVPGIWRILAEAGLEGIESAASFELLEKSISWSLDQKLFEKGGFPAWIPIGRERLDDFRFAWCYGDAGVAISLFSTARLLGNKGWEETALSIARNIAHSPPDVAKVNEAGLCHGSSGLGHILNRFYQATGEESFQKASRYWFGRTLQYRKVGEGIGG